MYIISIDYSHINYGLMSVLLAYLGAIGLKLLLPHVKSLTNSPGPTHPQMVGLACLHPNSHPLGRVN